jgi:hypothetical protein
VEREEERPEQTAKKQQHENGRIGEQKEKRKNTRWF